MADLPDIDRAIILKHLNPEIKEHIQDQLIHGLRFKYLESVSRPMYNIKSFIRLFKNASKIYLPVHILIMILRLVRAKKDKSKLKIVWRSIKEFIKSDLFATLFAMSIPAAYTHLKDINPRATSSWFGFIVSFVSSFAILLESSGRWGEMSLYVLAQWFEGFTYSLYKRKYAPVIPHWEKYVLMLAMGIIAWGYYAEEPEESLSDGKPAKMEFFMKFILGSKNCSTK